MPRPWGLAGVAAALGAVLVASTAPPSRDADESPAPSLAIEESPSPAAVVPPRVTMAEVEAPASSLRSALPGPGDLTQAPVKPIEPPSSILRFDYDLDHGTPMTPGNHDPQRTF